MEIALQRSEPSRVSELNPDMRVGRAADGTPEVLLGITDDRRVERVPEAEQLRQAWARRDLTFWEIQNASKRLLLVRRLEVLLLEHMLELVALDYLNEKEDPWKRHAQRIRNS